MLRFTSGLMITGLRSVEYRDIRGRMQFAPRSVRKPARCDQRHYKLLQILTGLLTIPTASVARKDFDGVNKITQRFRIHAHCRVNAGKPS